MVTCIFIKNANYVGKMSSDIFWLPFATRNLDSGIRKILALFHLESWPWNPEYKSRNLESCVLLVCYTAIFDVITHDDSKNGCGRLAYDWNSKFKFQWQGVGDPQKVIQNPKLSWVTLGHTPPPLGGGGALPYMRYIGMCHCEGYVFQAVYSGMGYINQRVWV